jgi:hypothetical protein
MVNMRNDAEVSDVRYVCFLHMLRGFFLIVLLHRAYYTSLSPLLQTLRVCSILYDPI